MTRRSWVFPLLVFTVLLITWRMRYTTFAWVPAPLFLSSLIAHTSKKPWRWLLGLALASELFSTLPFGIMTAAVLLPGGARRVARRIETDFSLWFFWYILAITGLQILTLCLPFLRQGWQFFPWPMALVSALSCAAAVFLLLVIRSFSLPSLWPR